MNVWCIVMGFGASWLSGLGCLSGFETSALALTSWGIRGVLVCGLAVATVGLCVAVVTDFCLLGTSLDRAGAAVCLVWLVFFEGVFFFGAVWTWGLIIDMQGHSVGVWGNGADAGVGVGLGTLGIVDGAGALAVGAASSGSASLGANAGAACWASGQSASVLGIVLLPVLGSLLVLLGVSLVLQLVHRASSVGSSVGLAPSIQPASSLSALAAAHGCTADSHGVAGLQPTGGVAIHHQLMARMASWGSCASGGLIVVLNSWLSSGSRCSAWGRSGSLALCVSRGLLGALGLIRPSCSLGILAALLVSG
jgi:hypothetical protein